MILLIKKFNFLRKKTMIRKDLNEHKILNNRAFGLEIELAKENINDPNITWDESKAISKRSLKIACDLIEHHNLKGIRCMYDGSKHVAIELVFPILFDCRISWAYVQHVLSIFKANGFYVSEGNGMHLHISTFKALETSKKELSKKSIEFQASKIERFIDNNDYDTIDFRNGFVAPSDLFQAYTEIEFEIVQDLFLRYSKNLDQINQFLPRSRHNSNFCTTSMMTETRINSASNISNLTFGKFSAINLRTFSKGTIEFRQALTTLNVDKIMVWFRFLDNLIRYSEQNRFERIEEHTISAPSSIRQFLRRSNTRQEIVYDLLFNSENELGIQTSSLVNQLGLTEQSIRRLISDIHSTFRRNNINSNDFLITHTFRENNSNYGDGIDNTSYQVKKEIRIEKGLKKLPLNRIGLESIFAELDDDTFAYLHQAKTNKKMKI